MLNVNWLIKKTNKQFKQTIDLKQASKQSTAALEDIDIRIQVDIFDYYKYLYIIG